MRTAGLLVLMLRLLTVRPGRAEVLTPPYFNLAEGRRVTATATCGEGVGAPELFCKLIGANSDFPSQNETLQNQAQDCDYCDPNRPDKAHPPEFTVDGKETWWQSPPLSRGSKYNEVNLTIDLGQEFQVDYVNITMANSPRPGVWVLEKSVDNGVTYEPWQFFADSKAECERRFGPESLQPISQDTSVICETQYSKNLPLENGEITVSLLLNRPSANNFFNSTSLQEWTRATNVRFRFLRTKNLLGHLRAVERQDRSVTRGYFYSIKEISIGGRCQCNGHADTCDIADPDEPNKRLCHCQHNTCGPNCEHCCPGFQRSQSKTTEPFVCETCQCDGPRYTGNCDEVTGNCECKPNYSGKLCTACSSGYYGFPDCYSCQCDGPRYTGNCDEVTGNCECKPNYSGKLCTACSSGYYGFPDCYSCGCNPFGSFSPICDVMTGECTCMPDYIGRDCYVPL